MYQYHLQRGIILFPHADNNLKCVLLRVYIAQNCFFYQPHEPPKVTCHTKIYHPNINLEGNVCLNILREDWKPVLDINSVIYGLIFLFYEPNPDDPLNHEAAELFRNDKQRFEKSVQRSLHGGAVNGEYFPRLL